MLDIQGSDDVNPLGKDILDILVPLRILAARHVCVRQLIDEHDLGPPGQDGIHIHFFHNNTAIFLPLPGYDFEPLQEPRDIGPAVGLHESHDHVDSFVPELVRFLEHPVGFPYACGIPEVYLQVGPPGPANHSQESVCAIFSRHILCPLVHIQVQKEYIHPRLTEDSQRTSFRVRRDILLYRFFAQPSCSCNTGRL